MLIPSTGSASTIFLILSSPYDCIKITSTQDRLYVPSVNSSMNSSSSSFLDIDRALFFRHRSWTWTETYSFEQDTSQIWCHSETSAVKAGPTNVRDNAILPQTASDDGAGTRFFSTDCVRRWRFSGHVEEKWGEGGSGSSEAKTAVTLCRLRLTFPRHVLKRLTNFLTIQFLFTLFYGVTLSQGTRKSRWSRVGISKIILDFCPVICLVRWIMVTLGKVEREVVKKLDYQW
jgi:hypothetical protein